MEPSEEQIRERETRTQQELARIKIAAATLKEHFDTVQIYCTKDEGNSGTARFTWGLGDYFARFGVTKLWVDSQSLEDYSNLDEDED
jgi:hypothetical protein